MRNRRNDITQVTQGWGVLQSLISLSKGNEKKKKKLLPHRVFVFGHPTKYEPRVTGLNFVERTTHGAVLVV